jgi:hypothetical protein
MKKSLTLLALVFGISGTYAQDLTSKKGEPILPEAGDWGLGIDATPFLDYAGNFFGKTTNNTAPTFNFLNSINTITGRYFIDAKTAWRGQINLGFGGPTVIESVTDRGAIPSSGNATGYPNVAEQKENKWKQGQTTVALSGGYEMRRGKTRLQGYAGAELGVYISSFASKFTYGNEIRLNQTGTTPNVKPDADDAFAGANNMADASTLGINGANGGANSARATVIKNGLTFGVGLRAVVGVEYFLLPKISLGGEFGWGLGLQTKSASKTTWETVGIADITSTTETTATTEIKGNKGNEFKLDTDNYAGLWGPAGTLRLNFYF